MSLEDPKVAIEYPDEIYLPNLDDPYRFDYNKDFMRVNNITGSFQCTFMFETVGTPFHKFYFYQVLSIVNDDNNSTIADLDDSPVHIDEPWVLFYLNNHKKLKYEMTKPSDEDIQAEKEKLILEQIQESASHSTKTAKPRKGDDAAETEELSGPS